MENDTGQEEEEGRPFTWGVGQLQKVTGKENQRPPKLDEERKIGECDVGLREMRYPRYTPREQH